MISRGHFRMCQHCKWISTDDWIMVSTLRPRQDARNFADDVLTCIFLNENVWISLKIPLKFVLRGPINNIPTLVQIKARRRPGDTPLSEPMLVFVPTHICVTRPQWVNHSSSVITKFWYHIYDMYRMGDPWKLTRCDLIIHLWSSEVTFVKGIHQLPVDFTHKTPATLKILVLIS